MMEMLTEAMHRILNGTLEGASSSIPARAVIPVMEILPAMVMLTAAMQYYLRQISEGAYFLNPALPVWWVSGVHILEVPFNSSPFTFI